MRNLGTYALGVLALSLAIGATAPAIALAQGNSCSPSSLSVTVPTYGPSSALLGGG
jgi:hypothetical protein